MGSGDFRRRAILNDPTTVGQQPVDLLAGFLFGSRGNWPHELLPNDQAAYNAYSASSPKGTTMKDSLPPAVIPPNWRKQFNRLNHFGKSWRFLYKYVAARMTITQWAALVEQSQADEDAAGKVDAIMQSFLSDPLFNQKHPKRKNPRSSPAVQSRTIWTGQTKKIGSHRNVR